MTKDYSELRKEIQRVLPGRNCDEPRSASLKAFADKAKSVLQAYTEAHPDYDALELRRVYYKLVKTDFTPYLYRNCPFYYEAGINGGWFAPRPGTIIRQFSAKFFHVPDGARDKYNARRAQKYILCCGFFTDQIHHIPPIRNIVTHGFRHFRDKAASELARCTDRQERDFLQTAIEGLDCIHALQLKFAAQAERILAEEPLTAEQRRFMSMVAESAKRCPWEAPQSFYEGLNTLWFLREIPALLDGLAVFALGRVDATLIGLYDHDIASGALTEAEAYDLICRFIVVADSHYDGTLPVEAYGDHELEIPITLGGCDSAGRPVYNALTRMFLKAHAELDAVFPKLHCRFDADSSHEYLQTIAEQVCKSHCVFALFNDSHNIPALVATGIPLEEARNYIGTGCWDGYVDSITEVDTANYVSVARFLEACIHPDEAQAAAAGVSPVRLEDYDDFDSLLSAFYSHFSAFLRDLLHDYTKYGIMAEAFTPAPAYSACITGCIESRRDVTGGGSLSKPRIVTMAFMANVVDSLCAIRTLCFERRVCTVAELLDAVRRNWAGAEALRQQAMACPHWGDDTEASNSLMAFLFDSIYRDIEDLKNDRGGPYLIAGWIYREFKFWGAEMKALPDGRHDGDYLSQGLVPSEFRCKEAITTVLNAIGSLDHSKIFASNCNMSFDGRTVTPAIMESIFRTFASKGIHLLQPNCFTREDLLDAQVHPERHASLMIKVCGFSARFVSLNRAWQEEVLQRHQYMG